MYLKKEKTCKTTYHCATFGPVNPEMLVVFRLNLFHGFVDHEIQKQVVATQISLDFTPSLYIDKNVLIKKALQLRLRNLRHARRM